LALQKAGVMAVLLKGSDTAATAARVLAKTLGPVLVVAS
jgi:hypothetical protein